MTSMNVSLPDQMKSWVEGRIDAGQYNNASEYVRDLIRKDQVETDKTLAFRAAIEIGRNSGIDNRSTEEIFTEAKVKAKNQ
ncbi:MAG: type II toxin-antitoxin system ParD family antitoxin [Zetaproteobacteria bacterium]|nr:MAG: type II toxin-antitoxin system ParD family antitoxin [Zetaproteobacteria bacterium]